MIVIDEKTQQKVNDVIKKLVKDKLLNGFKNRSHQPVVKITELSIINLPLDKSSDRDKLVIGPITIRSRVMVQLQGNSGESSNWLDLRINTVQFNYDYDTKEFEIEDPENITLIDMTN